MGYETVCYKNPCLSQVIIRIDFLEFVENRHLFNDSIERVLRSDFPQKGMQQIVRFQTMNVTFEAELERTEKTIREGLQQEFSNADGNKLVISNKYIVLEINKYMKYEDEIEKLLPSLRSIVFNSNVTSERTGIRYINEFGLNRLKPQKSYFTPPVAALLDAKLNKSDAAQLTRVMALSEYAVDDMHLNFRYGQFNPQYPQAIRTQSFVLDYDCYCQEVISGLDNIVDHINKGHDAIQELFENSITEKLRKAMCNV